MRKIYDTAFCRLIANSDSYLKLPADTSLGNPDSIAGGFAGEALFSAVPHLARFIFSEPTAVPVIPHVAPEIEGTQVIPIVLGKLKNFYSNPPPGAASSNGEDPLIGLIRSFSQTQRNALEEYLLDKLNGYSFQCSRPDCSSQFILKSEANAILAKGARSLSADELSIFRIFYRIDKYLHIQPC